MSTQPTTIREEIAVSCFQAFSGNSGAAWVFESVVGGLLPLLVQFPG